MDDDNLFKIINSDDFNFCLSVLSTHRYGHADRYTDDYTNANTNTNTDTESNHVQDGYNVQNRVKNINHVTHILTNT
jgi:hypothetical protein